VRSLSSLSNLVKGAPCLSLVWSGGIVHLVSRFRVVERARRGGEDCWEFVEGTSDVDGGLTGEGTQVGAGSSAGAKRTESAEDRLAEAQLIWTNEKVPSAIVELVLSSPYVQ